MINLMLMLMNALIALTSHSPAAADAPDAQFMRPAHTACACAEDEYLIDTDCIHPDELNHYDAIRFYNRYSIMHPDTYLHLR